MRKPLIFDVTDEILGCDPIEPLLRKPIVTEITFNRHVQVHRERFGKLELCDVQFRYDEHIRRIIGKIVTSLGRRVDESGPMRTRGYRTARVSTLSYPVVVVGPVLMI